MELKLRRYQEEVISSVNARFLTETKGMCVLPTGSGKTVIFTSLAKQLNKKTLAVGHTNEIISQIKETAKRVGTDLIEAISIQKLSYPSHRSKIVSAGFEMLIIDECHRAHAKTYKSLMALLPNSKILGFTATPFRYDKKKLSELFGDTICSISIPQMIDEGFLCDMEGYRASVKCSLQKISRTKGDFSVRGLTAVINFKNRNEVIVNKYLDLARGEKSICFCASVEHAQDLKKEFIEKGVCAEIIHGGLSKNHRESILKKFKSGEIRVLTNCQVLTEGFDEPSVTCLIMARPTLSKTLYLQMIGRGFRPSPGKEVCKVIEFTDNDYDVCFLEEIFESRIPNFKLKTGERVSDGFRQIKSLLDVSGEVILERKIIVPKSIYQRPASHWQLKELTNRKIKFPNNVTDFMATQLLSGI